jgi:hypothetical protein
MGGVGEALGLFVSHPAGAGWEARLETVRLAANLVIVVSNVLIARELVMLYAGKSLRLVAAIAALIVLCALAHVGVMVGDQPPAQPLPTVLKVLAAVFWVACAIRLPTLIAYLTEPPPEVPTRLAANHRPRDHEGTVESALAMEQLRMKARLLKDSIHNESWILGRAEALHELRDILADGETERCKI